MNVSRRLALACLALLVFPGRAAEPEKNRGALLLDAEVRAHLRPEEAGLWAKLDRDQVDAERQIVRAKEQGKGRRMDFVGAVRTPDQKAQTESLIKAGEERLKEIETSRAEIRAAIAERIRKTATVVACPVLSLRDAVTSGVTEVLGVARKAGYARVGAVGFIAAAGADRVRDPALSALLDDALASAQPDADAGGAAAVLLAELQPNEIAGGALVSLRLIEVKTQRVRHATLALVPSDNAALERRMGSEAEVRLAVLEDRSNFLPRLGKGDARSFEVEGEGASACLLKAVLASRAGPPLRDTASLAVAAGKRVTAVDPAGAYWTITPDPEAPGTWRVGSRAAAPRSAPLPVGVLRFVVKSRPDGR